MLSDIAIQKTKISISMEKLQVHFRAGIGGDSRIGETVDELLAELDSLHSNVKEQTSSLEDCLAQIDQYQQVRGQRKAFVFSVMAVFFCNAITDPLSAIIFDPIAFSRAVFRILIFLFSILEMEGIGDRQSRIYRDTAETCSFVILGDTAVEAADHAGGAATEDGAQPDVPLQRQGEGSAGATGRFALVPPSHHPAQARAKAAS